MISYIFDTEADRLKAHGFIAADIGKLAAQLSDWSIWRLAEGWTWDLEQSDAQELIENKNRLSQTSEGEFYLLPNCEQKYWKWVTDRYLEMSEAEKAEVDNIEIENLKISRINQCESDLHSYIYSTHPLPSQVTIMGLYLEAQLLNKPDVIAACLLVLSWVKSCVSYYRSCEDFINQDVNNAWSYIENCPRPEGLKTLSEIELM